MLMRIYHWWHEARSSFWFLPTLIVLGSVALAASIIAIDFNIEMPFLARWPFLLGAGAAGSRGVLLAVASSMITVAGVVFSMTIVALSLTCSQYSSRVLRNFMSNRVNQTVLGVFVGIFAYCLVVLRTIRAGDEGVFVPSLAVMVGLLLAFVGIGFLIYFIHHISVSIQASSIIAAITKETISVADQLYPPGEREETDCDLSDKLLSGLEGQSWHPVMAKATGYIQTVDEKALLSLASKLGTIIRMDRATGDFAIEGTPLASITILTESEEETALNLNSAYVIDSRRSIEDDVGLGIRQIVDVALKSLSSGVNDTTTAVMCVDALTAILVRLAAREFPRAYRFDQNQLRVITGKQSFENFLNDAFDQLRQNAQGNVAVLSRLLQALETIAKITESSERKRFMARQAKLISALAERSIAEPEDYAGIKSLSKQLQGLI